MKAKTIQALRDGSLGSTVIVMGTRKETLAGLADGSQLAITYMARDSEGSPVIPTGELISDEARFAFYRGLGGQVTELQAHAVDKSIQLS